MSPLHAPGATIAHPVFVNTACKEEAAIKVLMFPRRIRGDAWMMGVQLAWYLDRLDSGIPSFPAAVGRTERASFTRVCQRRKTLNRSLCLFTFHGFSLFLFTLCTSLCPCLKRMTSLGKHGWRCSGLKEKFATVTCMGWWGQQMGVFKFWSTFRCALWNQQQYRMIWAVASKKSYNCRASECDVMLVSSVQY